MDLIDILRISYLSAAAAILVAFVTPPLRDRFLAYGPRAVTSSVPSSSAEKEKRELEAKKADNAPNAISQILDTVADWQVPHDYFWTFYFISTSLSAFWPGEVLYLKGPLYAAVADHVDNRGTSMSFQQVQVAWAMMLAQGCRRLYECLSLSEESEWETSKSASEMWAGHWVMGLLFYIATSVAVWIEGLPAIKSHNLAFRDLVVTAPTFRTIFSILIFILASGFQHDCHKYLADLKSSSSKSADTKTEKSSKEAATTEENTYKLPTHPAFQPLISPHYTAECFIYLSLAIVAAPRDHWINGTLACALIFVTINLGVTAFFTKRWYEKKFGPDAVKGKWRMIPPIY